MKNTAVHALVVLACLTGASAHGQDATSHMISVDKVSERHQAQLKQIASDRSAYAAAIVSRWEPVAEVSGKYDSNFAADLYPALIKMSAENLANAGEAASYDELQSVLATGSKKNARVGSSPNMGVSPQALGDSNDDLVYTAIPQCRIIDTRKVHPNGALFANASKSYDADGSTFTPQGGNAGPCGIPFGVAYAVLMTIHSVTPVAPGVIYAWQIGGPQPVGPVLNFSGEVATTAIIPITPGAGPDFELRSSVNTQTVVDVIGYFAAPTATQLDCTTAQSSLTAVANNAWTSIDAFCPIGYTATGGGFDTSEGTLGFPGVWITSVPIPNSNGWRAWVDNQTGSPRNVISYARCCRVPGR